MELDMKVGVVSSVDEANLKVRVMFPDADNMVSDWLFVLQTGGETDEAEGMKTDSAGKHKHTINAHTHTATVSDATVTINNAGSHAHTIVDPATSTESAGDHTHTANTHTHTVTNADATPTENEAGEHKHDIGKHSHKIKPWMPAVNDRVLCLLFGGDEETDGFVLGAIS